MTTSSNSEMSLLKQVPAQKEAAALLAIELPDLSAADLDALAAQMMSVLAARVDELPDCSDEESWVRSLFNDVFDGTVAWARQEPEKPAEDPRSDFVVQFVESKGWRYHRNDRGVLWLSFRAKSDQVTELSMTIKLNGIFEVLGFGLPEADSAGRSVLLEFANKWNETRRWPTASVSDDQLLSGSFSVPIGTGVSWEAFHDIAMVVVEGTLAMFEEVRAEAQRARGEKAE